MNYLERKPRLINPEEKTNIISQLFFTYTRKILTKGLRKSIDESDIYEILPSYKSENLGNRIEKAWEKQRNENKFSILVLLCKCFGKEYLFLAITKIVALAITLPRPNLVKKFISSFSKDSEFSKSDSTLYGVILIVLVFFTFLYEDNFQLRLGTLSLKMRAAFTSLIYRKVLKTNQAKIDSISVGKIITLITRDVNEFESFVFFVTYLWSSSVHFIMICFVLYFEIGWLVIVLIALFCLILLMQLFLASLITKLKSKTLTKTDQRYQITKEILNAIRLIKCYTWIDSFEKKVLRIREDETHLLHKIYLLLAVKCTLSESILHITWYLIIISSILLREKINAGTLFFVLNTLDIISVALKIGISKGIHEMLKMKATFKRIQFFLLEAENGVISRNKTKFISHPKIILSNLKTCIKYREICYKFGTEITTGLTVITGSIGSGKSLLLNILMNEYNLIEGKISVDGTISYASQEPWLFPSTIKQNILFGSKFSEKRYVNILHNCALLPDLNCMVKGDRTIVADRGANLSKGQQARINLARAIYKNSDIYLLDDCLSNLDVVVSDFVFEECIKKYLKDKIVILVTQNKKYIAKANNVINLDQQDVKTGIIPLEFSEENDNNKQLIIKEKLAEIAEFNNNEKNFSESVKLLKTIPQKNIYEEKKFDGTVAFKTYKKYFKYGGLYLCIVVFVIFGLNQISKSGMHKVENNWYVCYFI